MRSMLRLHMARPVYRPQIFGVARQQEMAVVSRPCSIAAALPVEQIPGPRSLPLIGTLYKYLPGGQYSLAHIYRSGRAMMEEYGPIVREEIVPGTVMIRLFDPNDIETVYRNEGKVPNRVPVMPLKQYLESRGRPGGLATVNGEEWYTYRSLVQAKMMRPGEVAAYLSAQDEVGDDFMTRLKLLKDDKNEVPEFLQELYRWATESIGVVCFDTRLGTLNQEDDKDALNFITNVNKVFHYMHKAQFMARIHAKGFTTKTWIELCSAFDVLWGYTVKYIDMAEKSSTNQDSLLHKLLSNPDLPRDRAMVMVSDLFAGGVDTTAHTLAFNLYHLARNPDKQEKLYEEIMNNIPKGAPLTERLVNRLSYLRACMRETMRLTPTVAPGTMRILDKDVVLSGYKVPAGVGLFFHTDVISRMPEYFEEPERFLPERWMRETRSESGCPIHPFASLPFGHGPRMCIGKRFAEQEMLIALVKIMQNFEVQYHYEDIGQVLRLVNMPDKPLRYTFLDRD